MASNAHVSHFVLIPFMCQGHLIPLVDIAKLIAERNVLVTIITTPQNASRFGADIDRAIKSGLPIHVIEIQFPSEKVGLPKGCETVDVLPWQDVLSKFMVAASMLQQPIEKVLEELNPSPSCIISDRNLPWTADVAYKFLIPRIIFDGKNCFCHLCSHNLSTSKVHENVSETEPFVIPGLADRIEVTKAQLPGNFNPGSHLKIFAQSKSSVPGPYGLLVNTFEELEAEYVNSYRKISDNKLWCVGPVSLCSKDNSDKAQRGDKAAIDENHCLKWLDKWPQRSVIYVCLGSINQMITPQLAELGLALEATNRPFIWSIRGGSQREEMEKWLKEDGFEERVKERGLLIRGWSPQVLILSHPAVGGFLTHCGWNSTLEGICAGVPMATWPLFAEQFLNEKLAVQVLKIGVPVGAEFVVHLGEEEKYGVVMKRENIKKAVESLMEEGEEAENRRQRARKLADMAKKAVEKGGSSYLNITLLIEDIVQQATRSSATA